AESHAAPPLSGRQMIALSRLARKGRVTAGGRVAEMSAFRGYPLRSWCSLTLSLGNSTMKPNFGQRRALVDCEKTHSRLGSRSRSGAGFLSPPAPRGLDRPDPSRYAYG